MKTYEYRGFDVAGRAARGLVEALDAKEAREKLAGQSILAERVWVSGRCQRLPAGLRALIYRELSSLLGAGLPLVHALDLLLASPELERSRGILAGMLDRIREGRTLAESLRESSSSVSPFELAIITAAETSATVGPMLSRLSGFLEEQERLRERIRGALIYPAIVVGVGILVAAVMLGVLVPRTHSLFGGAGASLPWLTAATMWLGRVMVRWGWVLALVSLAAVWILSSRWRRDATFRENWNRRGYRLPWFGYGYTLLVNLRFARTMAILLHSGVPAIEGFRLAGRSTGSCWVARLVEQEALAVQHGKRLSEGVRAVPPLAGMLAGLLHVGEISGDLTSLLESAGERLQGQWTRFVERSLACLEPLLILLIGGFVLLVTLSVLLPVLTLSRMAGG